MKKLSTSALAKERGIDSKELFSKLSSKGWIYKKDSKWQVTNEGRIAGGDMQYNPRFGDYVVWPSDLDIDQEVDSNSLLNATKIGEHFYGISSRKINVYIMDNGWMIKDRGGWTLTKQGKKNGGHQMEYKDGKPYVLWKKSILENIYIKNTIDIGEGKQEIDNTSNEKEIDDSSKKEIDWRKRNRGHMRATDGHYVRSRAEMLVDNFLYYNNIVHTYEKKVNISERNMFCDFYINHKHIFIEVWGNRGPNYEENKKQKKELYAKHQLNLIEIEPTDLDNLDEILTKKLRQFGITLY
jgi:phage antirepressor YoqD-like protein